ncbi:MAG: hypothetical protein KAF40_01220 [Flavihumibacter sp.]|nr:hypothetical protein [Flavihumibacter sp.]
MSQKHLNISAILYLFAYMVIIVIVLTGCRSSRMPAEKVIYRDSIVEVEKIVKVAVPPIVLPGKTITLHEPVPCPDVQWGASNQTSDGKLKVSAKLSNGQLTVRCNLDSMQVIQDSLEAKVKVLETHKSVETEKYIPVPKPYIPWWAWLMGLLGVCGIIIALKR